MTKMEQAIHRLLCHWKNIQAELRSMRHIENAERRIDAQRKLYLMNISDHIETFLALLSETERYVLKSHLVEGMCWDEVCNDYGKVHHEGVSKATLRRIQARALTRIATHLQNGQIH